MSERHCQNCLHYMINDEITGWCKRYPPTIMEGLLNEESVDEHGRASTFGEFPMVTYDDYCGEFSPDPTDE